MKFSKQIMKSSKKGSPKKEATKKQKKEVSKKQLTLSTEVVVQSDWYLHMLEQISATVVETVFTANSTLINGKLEVGKLLSEGSKEGVSITELVQLTARDLKTSEREMWYCVKFNDQYKKLQKLPDFQSKALSWNKVKKLISSDSVDTQKPCTHEHTVKIVCCEDCGKKLDD